MNNRYTAWYFRLAAFLLAAVCLGFGFLSGIASVYCVAQGYFYKEDHHFQTTWQCAEAVRSEGWNIINQFRRNPDYETWSGLLRDTDLRFILVEEPTGKILASYTEGLGLKLPENLANNPYLDEYNTNMALGKRETFLETIYVCDYYFGTTTEGHDWAGFSSSEYNYTYGDVYVEVRYAAESGIHEAPAVLERTEELPKEQPGSSYQILYLLPQSLNRHDGDMIYETYAIYRLMAFWSTRAPFVFAACFVGFLAAMLFLLITAGKRPGQDEIQAAWPEKIPADVLLAAAVLAGIGIIGMVVVMADLLGYMIGTTVKELWRIGSLCAAGSAACGTFLLAVLRSCVVRLRLHCFWKSMWTVRLLGWLLGLVKKLFAPVGEWLLRGVRSVGLVPRAAAVMLSVCLIECLLLVWLFTAWNHAFPIAVLLVFNLFVLAGILWGLGQLRLLQKAAKSLADGNLDEKLDTAHMYWHFKRHGEDLNAIAGGMNKAVEQRMKSERLKTELITNVSHDIKTPLTSILNYVDLLQKPHTEAEQTQYLEVLERQSKRLKKLTENLVEASKAATGNLPVELCAASVTELLHQAVGEYRQRLDAERLELILRVEDNLQVLADGKHMWRIMDNLLNNVVKYAMAGTRVYVSAYSEQETGVIVVKNISRDPLNMDAEELMERFVRGDSSRHSEGSGLGLSIVRSLAVLQNGRFEVTVDGDLFKAEIRLPVV